MIIVLPTEPHYATNSGTNNNHFVATAHGRTPIQGQNQTGIQFCQ